MAQIEIKARIVPRNDISSNWTSANPVLLKNEIGIEIDTGKIKLGDGVKNWNDLAYIYTNIENSEIDSIISNN